MAQKDLLPCPFCGSPAEKDGYGFYHLGGESTFIKCSNSECRVRPRVSQNQDEYGEWDIEEAWNTRATV